MYQIRVLRSSLCPRAPLSIGEACALRFAEAGCSVILVARRVERLNALSARLAAMPECPGVHVVALDVRDTDRILALPAELPPGLAEVDILVNNAGLALGVAAADALEMEDAFTMLDTNVKSVMAFTRAFAPGMRARGRGHIINMSSIAGQEAYGGGSAYCASKHAVDAFTTATRHDLVGTPVRVTAISPGAVRTEFSVVRFGGDQAKADDVYAGIEPLLAEDIADNVLYAATRPAHVQVADITVFATYQSSAKGLARVLK